MAFPLARAAYRGVKRLFKRRPKKVKRVSKPKRVNGVISVCRIKQEAQDLVACNTIEAGNYTFELADFPEYASYQQLYEYYRIDKVQVSFRAMNNTAQTAGITPGTIFNAHGRIHTVIDYNDAANFPATRAGIQEMMQDNSYKCTTSSRTHTRTFVPKILMEGGGSSVGVVSKGKQWIPIGNTTANLTHYALKYILEGGYSSVSAQNPYASFLVEPTIKMWVSFKDPQ
jgi:hypothetical protein